MKTWLMRLTGTTTCEEVERFAYAYLEEELDAEVAEKLGRHLRGCRNCERFFHTYRQIARPERLLQEIVLPPGFESRAVRLLKDNGRVG